MNTQAIRMIVWKDYRVYRSLWLALFAATFGLQCLSYFFLLWRREANDMLASLIW